MAITPDGRHLYVANTSSSTILAFDRNPNTGVLSLKAGAAGCISNTGAAPCRDARAMAQPYRIALDRDGRFLYVASVASDAVTALSVGADGSLTQVADGLGGAGCVQQVPDATDACADGRGLDGALGVTVSRDGTAVYATGFNGGSLSAMLRDPTTGRLQPVTGDTGCVEDAAADLCRVEPDLTAAWDITTGPDGRVYVAAYYGSRVLTFDPQPNGGLVRRAGEAGCVNNGARAGCKTGRALNGPSALAVSPDGEDVYVAGSNSGSVVELDRGADGSLAPRSDVRGCIVAGTVADCTTVTGFTAFGVAVSPDGRFVYSALGNRISVLKRDSGGPECTSVTVTVNAGTVGPLKLPCSDRDGDALTYSIINPPTLGALGALDNASGTVVYAAPQGQNGTTTFTFKAGYDGLESTGSITVNVVGASNGGGGGVVLPAGIDNDGDGFFAGQDCNDNDPAIRPGALEVKGNRVDENCDGIAEPFPTLTSGVVHNWDFKKKSPAFTLRVLTITQQLPKGISVTIKCSGKKCPFKSKKLKLPKPKRNALNVIGSLTKKQRRFRAGQTVEVWISAPEFNSKVARIKLKQGKQPVIEALCAFRGQRQAQKRCV